MTVEPRWDRDVAYGVQGELAMDDLLDQLARRVLSREDKRKRRHDARLFVEVEQNPLMCGVWRPSGIETSDADVWTFTVDEEHIIFVFGAGVLRRAVAEARRRHVRLTECGGSNPTRGYLLSVDKVVEWGAQS